MVAKISADSWELNMKLSIDSSPDDEAAKLAAASRLRMSAATTIQLVQAMESWFADRGTRDLVKLLEPIKMNCSWKTSPNESLLASFSDLAAKFVGIAPNMVIGHAKLANAISGCHQDHTYSVYF